MGFWGFKNKCWFVPKILRMDQNKDNNNNKK